jgi:tetratricopeptide (TPR) repeat protein
VNKTWALFLLVPLIVSCATVVTFDVEHPPLVDLRGAGTITVIPFEWNTTREQGWLASRVTEALLNGLRRGSIDVIDPYALEYSGGRNYGQYADVYITGRMINVNTFEQVETKSEVYSTHTIIREFITGTAIVDIEYNYIRSADSKILGNFKKRETAYASFERTRYRDHDTNQNANRNANRNTDRNTNRNTNRDTDRRGTGQSRGGVRSTFPQRGTWQEDAAASAIAWFSDAMNHELGPWTTTESRKVKGRTGDRLLAAEAKDLVEQNRYDEALALYKTIYEQDGNIFAGYNAAILLAANEQFADALGLLERLRERRLKAGKTVPAFIKNEIKHITEFINASRALEVYSHAAIPTAAAAAAAAATAAGREITGTVNLSPAMVYALNGSVSSIDDNSIFPKMVAYADAVDGRWSMRLSDTAPAAVWLLVTDGRRDYYITKTAINISGSAAGAASGAIALNTAVMTKLAN